MKSIQYTFLLLITIILSSCYAIRGARYHEADIDDYKIFPSAQLTKSTTPFQFIAAQQPNSKLTQQLDDYLENTNTAAFIVIRNDSILYERYDEGFQKSAIIPSFSVAKSFTSTLLGIAIDEGYIKNTSEPITKYIPELIKKGEAYKLITIQDCLDMRSGLDNQENYSGYNVFTPMVRMYYGKNLNKEVFNVKLKGSRGSFNYQSINTQVLALIVERATGKKLQDYLQEKIWQPLGMQFDATWSLDSKKRNTVKAFAALNAAPLDFAKLGRLFLHDGKNQEGKQIISKNWVATTTNFAALKEMGYKNQWWSAGVAKVFTDSLQAVKYRIENPHTGTMQRSNMGYFWFQDYGKAYMAEGILNQFIYVRPDKNLIIVRNGDYSKKRIRVSKAENYSIEGFLGYVSDRMF